MIVLPSSRRNDGRTNDSRTNDGRTNDGRTNDSAPEQARDFNAITILFFTGVIPSRYINVQWCES